MTDNKGLVIAASTSPKRNKGDQLFPELLAQVFMNVISIPDIDESLCNRQSYIATPYLLSSVCQFWRAVATSTPALWSVQPRIGLHDLKRSESFIDLFYLHVLRSGSTPIHVALSARGGYSHTNFNPNCHPALIIVIRHGHRWKSLVVEGMMFTPLFQLLSTIDQFPVLVSLKLHDPQQASHLVADTPDGLSIFKNSPMLRYAIISGWHCHGYSKLPWLEIRRYVGLPCSVVHLAPISTRLESCMLRGPIMRMHPSREISFPFLSTLRLDNRNAPFPRHISPFDNMVAPVLQELEVVGYCLSSLEVLNGVISLLSRSSATSLRRLTLHTTGNFMNQLLSLFSLTPNLEELDILDLPVKNLAHLVLTNERKLLPRLSKLTIRQFIGSDASVLVTIQRSRSGAVLCNPAVSYMEPVRLLYSSSSECHKAQSRVEGWERKTGNDQEISRVLSQRNYLCKNFLGRSPGEITKYKLSGKKKHWEKRLCNHGSKLDILFSTLENYDFKYEVLRHTQLHSIMRDISLLPTGILPGDDRYHFRSRASDLIQKWTSTLLPDVKSRSWVIDKTGMMLQNIEWYDDGQSHPDTLDIIFR